MVMSQAAVKGLLSDVFPEWRRATNKAKMLDLWIRGENDDPAMPLKAQSNTEYKQLGTLSPTPWARLLIGSAAQPLSVIDQRDSDPKKGSTLTFKHNWKPNALISRQGALYRGALGHNLAYTRVKPGTLPHTGKPIARIEGVSATRMLAFYDDEGIDEFARFAVSGVMETVNGEQWMAMEIEDDEATYYLTCDLDGTEVDFIEYRVHNVGITPVHRFSPLLDLDGRATGEIQPFLPILRRIDQDNFDRLVVQRFNSWRTRTISGMVKPATDEERRAAQISLRVEDLLVSSSSDTKFGTLDPTDMKPYIEAREADIRDLAATSQTPPHHLLGQIANLSAEALAAAEASLMRKVEEYQLSFAQSWSQTLRTAAFIMATRAESAEDRAAYLAEATDYETSIRWKDSASRSLSQMADAMGKIAVQLGVPVEMLWEELPFWKEEDTERAKGLLADAGADAMMMQFLEAAGNSATPTERQAAGKPVE